MENKIERETPMEIEDTETGRVYVLDFNRETRAWAEERGFNWDGIEDHIATYVPLIWFAAFRRYEPRISLEKTTKMLEELGGLQPKWAVKLKKLYDQAVEALVAEDGETKNGKLTVRL